jgi:hypothetical protein
MTATTATTDKTNSATTASIEGATATESGPVVLFEARGVVLDQQRHGTKALRLRIDERTEKGARSFALKVSDVLCGKHGPNDPTRLAVRAIALDCPRNGGTLGWLEGCDLPALRRALRRCAAKLETKERKHLAAQARMGRSIRAGGRNLETLISAFILQGFDKEQATVKAQALLQEEAERRAVVLEGVRAIEADLKAAKRRARRLL